MSIPDRVISRATAEAEWIVAGHGGDCGGSFCCQVQGNGVVLRWWCSCVFTALDVVA